jgi:hypothetical protein
MSDERVVASGDAKTVKRESARRTRRSFLVGGVAAAAGYGVVKWIEDSKPAGELPGVLRRSLEVDAAVNRKVFEERGMAPEYAVSEARPLRLNGVVGLEQMLEPESWRLQLVGVAGAERSPLYVKDVTAWQYKYAGTMQAAQTGEDMKSGGAAGGATKAAATKGPVSALNSDGLVDSPEAAALAAQIESLVQAQQTKRYEGDGAAGASYSGLNIGTPGLLLTMGDLMKLPKVEFCTEFKCIEGWSVVTQWGGVRLRDLMDAYPPEKVKGRLPRYVYMETPDGDYYCGYDMQAAQHPQSLLVTEMSGQPLAQEHGAPLRLHMPIKYGYKQIKRIGLIAYTDDKPDDFWTKLGYDWYAGL